MSEQRLGRGLGWFGIGLGLAELLFPEQLGRAIGVGEQSTLLRALGLRELGSGMGILAGQQLHSNWLRARVAGDAMDLALLGLALVGPRTQKSRVLVAGAAVAGVTALDILSTQQLSHREGLRRDGTVELRASIAVNRPAEELYRFWRQLDNIARVMSHVQSVRDDGNRMHWLVKAPNGKQFTWDAQITDDQASKRLAWQSLEGAPVRARGAVDFSALPTGRGTRVRLTFEYAPPGGAVTSSIVHAFKPLTTHALRQDLRRFKQLIETGEIATIAGQPSGRRSVISRNLP
jgi:uncharacterized membrane protein